MGLEICAVKRKFFFCSMLIAEYYSEENLDSKINLLHSSGHYMYRQFNIHNSTFCPHSVFMCFVWI